MNIFESLSKVMADCGVVGKDSVNQQQKFKYRGIDAVMNAINPALVKNKVFVVPEVLEQTREERESRNGGNLIYSICKVKYTFYAEDGTNISAVVIGEGMDSGDKATNKAMAIAFKYALFQVFCIPTEEMPDPDAECHEVKPKSKKADTKVETPKTVNSAADWAKQKIESKHAYVFGNKCKEKGIDPKMWAERFGIDNVMDMTMGQFRQAMDEMEQG